MNNSSKFAVDTYNSLSSIKSWNLFFKNKLYSLISVGTVIVRLMENKHINLITYLETT